MSKGLVIRNGIKILGTLGSGTGDPLLTLDSTSKEVGSIPSIDTSTYITSALPSANLLVGNASNIATPRTITGQVLISDLGVTSIAADTITNTHINSGAGIQYSKLTLTNSIVNNDIATNANIARTKIVAGTAYRVLVNNGAGVLSEQSAITANRVLISDSNGLPTHSTTTTTVLGYLDATSSIQTQLNNKLSFSSSITPVNGDILYYTGGAWTNLGIGTAGQILTVSAGLPAWATASGSGSLPTGGTTDQYLRKVDGTNYNTTWDTLTLSKITDITASAAQVNVLATGFYDASSSVQTQISSKLDRTLNQNHIFVGNSSNLAVPLATGANGYILTSVSGVPTWVAPTGGTVTSVSGSGGTTGLTLTGGPITGSGTLTIGGTLVVANGGTGLSALGTANQLLRVNAGATALEYFTPSFLTGNQTITLSGEATGSGATSITVTLTNSAVIDKVLTGFTSGAGTVSATDTILQAIQKLDGNIDAKQNALGFTPVNKAGDTMSGDLTITPQAGTGNRLAILDSAGKVVRYANARVDTTTKTIRLDAGDDLDSSYTLELYNQSEELIARFRNDRSFELGGDAYLLELPSNIPSGASQVIGQHGYLSMYAIKDNASNTYWNINSDDEQNEFFQKIRMAFGTGKDSLIDQIVFDLPNTTAGGTHEVLQIPVGTDQLLELTILEAQAYATNGYVNACDGVIKVHTRNDGGTISGVNSTITPLRIGATTGGFSISHNDTDKRCDVIFTNDTGTGRQYRVSLTVLITLSSKPSMGV